MRAVAAPPSRPATTCSYCGEAAQYDYIVGRGREDERVVASACGAVPCKGRLWDNLRWRWAN